MAAEVNNSKPPVPQVNRVLGITPHAFTIGPTVGNGISHFF
jgi:hypothetical protein